jgi:hypothetical protein
MYKMFMQHSMINMNSKTISKSNKLSHLVLGAKPNA